MRLGARSCRGGSNASRARNGGGRNRFVDSAGARTAPACLPCPRTAALTVPPTIFVPQSSKRQPVVELPRLRLPLPERTGSDRDELLSPHGFVDRAYSVFLLRCVSLLRTSHCIYRATVGASIPPLSCYSPEAGSHLRALLLRGVNEGTSPWAHPRPLLLRLRYDVPCLERPAGNRLDGGPEGRAPMEVPDLRASRPND